MEPSRVVGVHSVAYNRGMGDISVTVVENKVWRSELLVASGSCWVSSSSLWDSSLLCSSGVVLSILGA